MIDRTYSLPGIYEIAFSFRDYPQACDFIAEAANLAGSKQIGSMLELGCGPGQYCLEFAKRGIKACGLDLSEEMTSHVRHLAESKKLNCSVILNDMRDFQLGEPVDLAVCMMATPEHLLTNRDMLDHLNSVADGLSDDGIYIMEMSHPRDFLTPSSSTQNHWTMESGETKVTTYWGENSRKDADVRHLGDIDPLTEISDVKVRYIVEKHGKTTEHQFETQTRAYTAGLMRALIELSGRFKIANMYGDLDVNQPFDNTDKSWRMIFVLKKWA